MITGVGPAVSYNNGQLGRIFGPVRIQPVPLLQVGPLDLAPYGQVAHALKLPVQCFDDCVSGASATPRMAWTSLTSISGIVLLF